MVATNEEARRTSNQNGAGRHRARTGRDVLDLPVLVLSRGFQPVAICTVRESMALLYSNRVHVLDEHGELHAFDRWAQLKVESDDDAIGTVRGAFRAPRIVRLHHHRARRVPPIRLSRQNLMLRDELRCQYCGDTFPEHRLDIDHVVPRSRGGPNAWDNLVTSCLSCNRRKGAKTPSEARMPLLRQPKAPRWSRAAHLLIRANLSASPQQTEPAFAQWAPFLQAS